MTACWKKLFNFICCQSLGSYVWGLFRWNHSRIFVDKVINIIKSIPCRHSDRHQVKTPAVVPLHKEQFGQVLLAPLHNRLVHHLTQIFDICTLAFKHTEGVTVNTQQSSGLSWDIYTVINRKHPSVLMTGVIIRLHLLGHTALYMFECVRPSFVELGTFTLWLTCVAHSRNF